MSTLETVSGKVVNLADPDPSTLCIQDIAWALSRMARFSGHTLHDIPYVVGQHCVAVARRLESQGYAPIIVLHGLLHDADEAYTGDIAGPLKKIPELRPHIKAVGAKILSAVYESIGIPEPTEEQEHIVKEADIYSQALESYMFMHSRGMNWEGRPNISLVELHSFEMPKSNVEVYEEFMSEYERLMKMVKSE